VDITVLCDTVAVFPEPIEVGLPDWSAEHQRWTVEHMPGNLDPGGAWWLHFHSYLLTGDRGATLVDTGIGPAGGEAANIEQQAPRFRNATYLVQRAELDHVTARPNATYERLVRPIADAGQLRVVDGETKHQGMRLLPMPGHTPGHQCVVTDRAVLGGDVLVHPAQARWPELTYVYEHEPEVAMIGRREILALAAAMEIPIAAAHPHASLDVEPTVQARPTPGQGAMVCPPHKL
jgi:glyoxylase-like metal-dependent hydrolase (beta-lactamase superfamily II)